VAVNARLIPVPGDARLPVPSSFEIATLLEQQDTLEDIANRIDDARIDLPTLADPRLDRRSRRLNKALLLIEKLTAKLAEDVRDSVED
jgi:hypothetical protein